MKYTTFSKKKNNFLFENMFLGQNVNISRFDQQKYPILEKLTEAQLSFFWRPEEIDLSQDRIDFKKLTKNEKEIFINNLKYQILLDSIQSRGPNVALLNLVSIPELETWIETWSFFETIHSRSYTYIIRNIFDNPSIILNKIVSIKEIIDRAKDISKYYDDLIMYSNLYNILGYGDHIINKKKININSKKIKEKIYLCLISINALESIRFYVSFACSFSFAERNLMEGNAKIIKLIARDEALHVSAIQQILNIIHNNNDDEEMFIISKKSKNKVYSLFKKVVKQEKIWVNFLFKKKSIIGLNKKILHLYIEYITNVRMQYIGLKKMFHIKENPIPWINHWLKSDNIQVAPQETESSSYLTNQINSNLDKKILSKFKL
ncbi:MAG: class Ia ribonucleoside-diphosphate reductase subunit beta [Enterobacteriaceae bacterium]